MTSVETGKLLALSMLKGVGPVALRNAITVSDFLNASIESIGGHVVRIGSALAASPNGWAEALEKAEQQLEWAEKSGARVISVLDEEYPALLKATKDDPVILFVKGHLHAVPNSSAAVIGTREPTRHGIMIAERIAHFFIENSWSVVSGLAIGCDSVAHQTAINKGGHTVAVLAHGLHTVAPSQNKKLAQEILSSGGALVTEYPFGHDAAPSQFVKRDRIQAGLAQGVVMVQSDVKGGSLHASRAALDYGRWLAVPYPTGRDLSEKEAKVQANILISDGNEVEVSGLLKCPSSALSRVVVLRSKDDYALLLNEEVCSSDSVQIGQGSLL